MAVLPNARGQDYIPKSDADLLAWSLNFLGFWVPATYNAVTPLVATITTANTTYSTALAASTNAGTRGPFTIAAKNTARTALVALLRAAVRQALVAFRSGIVSESQLIALGVNPPKLTPTPVAVPLFAPLIGFGSSQTGSIKFRITQVDLATGAPVTLRAFPLGIVGVEIETKVGAAEWISRGLRKRVNLTISTSGETPGVAMLIRARYQTASGKFGPRSTPATGIIVG